MTKTEKATQQMEAWARDDSHGYDQAYRWGQRGDYDCSSAVITAWELAGVPVKSSGATYTGNIRPVFLANGFSDVTSKVNISTGAGLVRGDVLLNIQNHVAMYCGDGKEVEASINEFGGVTGGQPGDQTGYEFLIRSYRVYPHGGWDCVLRYKDSGSEKKETKYMFEFALINYGDSGKDVKIMQACLKGRGYIDRKTGKAIEVDGKWGDATQRALEHFCEKNKLAVKKKMNKAMWKKLLWR